MGIPEKTVVSFPVSVWFAADTGLIHIARPTDSDFATSISADPNHPRGHIHLYRHLAAVLRAGGAPAPDIRPRVEPGGD